MEKLKLAQDLIKTNNGSVGCGFDMFIHGHRCPTFADYGDIDEAYSRIQGFHFAEKMAVTDGIAFTYNFGCDCGGVAFQYGGFFVCNSCGGKGVDKEWWKIKVVKDGNQFCCHGLDFINLQDSNNYAFGKSFDEAIDSYGLLMKKITV